MSFKRSGSYKKKSFKPQHTRRVGRHHNPLSRSPSRSPKPQPRGRYIVNESVFDYGFGKPLKLVFNKSKGGRHHSGKNKTKHRKVCHQ